MSEDRHIVLASDHRTSWGLAAAVGSLFKFAPWAKITVIDGGVNRRVRERLLRRARERKVNLGFRPYEIPEQDRLRALNGSHFTYARFFLEYFVEEDLCLYLDADVVVRGDLGPLFELGSKRPGRPWLWAARDPLEGLRLAEIGPWVPVPGETRYFNAGVLLIDLVEWRKTNIPAVCMGLCIEHRLKAHDQDALNIVYAGKWVELPGRYNRMLNAEGEPDVPADSVVLHYVGMNKPWLYGCARKDVGPFLDGLAEAGWPAWKPRFDFVEWYRNSGLRKRLAQGQYRVRLALGLSGLRRQR